MKLRYLYLLFTLIGLILPYWQFVPWIAEHHALNMSIFLRDLFAGVDKNRCSNGPMA